MRKPLGIMQLYPLHNMMSKSPCRMRISPVTTGLQATFGFRYHEGQLCEVERSRRCSPTCHDPRLVGYC